VRELWQEAGTLRGLSRSFTCGPGEVPVVIDKLRRELMESREALGAARAKLADQAMVELAAALERSPDHRVVAVLDQPSGRFFTTQGDANSRADARPVAARDVVGEVRWRIVGLGSMVDALAERRVQLALVGVPLGLLLLSEAAGRRSRRLGKVISALQAEIEWLRNLDRPAADTPSYGDRGPLQRARRMPRVPSCRRTHG